MADERVKQTRCEQGDGEQRTRCPSRQDPSNQKGEQDSVPERVITGHQPRNRGALVLSSQNKPPHKKNIAYDAGQSKTAKFAP